jgi:1,4-dihydroxy-2-naphthoate octaprenyltransferase
MLDAMRERRENRHTSPRAGPLRAATASDFTAMSASHRAASASRPTPFRAWWQATRPPTLSIAVVPVLVALALAHRAGAALDWVVALLTLAAAVLIQIGTNLYNDVGDFERGADGLDRLGPPRAVSLGWLSPADVRRAAATSFGVAMLLGAYLVSVGGWPIFLIGLGSVFAGIAYTGGPKPIAYSASGELFVLLFFGLIATCGTYYLQTGELFAAAPVVAGVMVGAIASAVLVVNNYRDFDSDRRTNKVTLAVRIGREATRREFAALVALPFVLLPVLAAVLGTRGALLLPLAAVPLALVLVRRLARTPIGPGLNDVLKGTARLQLLFGALLAIAIAFPTPG